MKCKLVLGVMLAVAAFAAPTLTLNPLSGQLSGAPGSTVGWGFTLSNTTDFLLVNSAAFCEDPLALPLCIPPNSTTVGTFSDFISGNFIVVGPSPELPSVSQVFDNLASTGIGSFVFAPSALPVITTGQIVLTYSLFSVSPNDPNFDPQTDLISNQQFLTAPASLDPTATIPEPSTIGLLSLGLTGLLYRKHRS